MKKNLKNKVVKTMATILTAVIFLMSGGYTVVANMFGFSKGNNKDLMMNEENNSESILSVSLIESKEIKKDSKYQYQYNKVEDEYLIDGIVTTEVITQEENINRLIRKRKKETQERIK